MLVEDSDGSKKRVIRSIRSADVDVLRDRVMIQGPGAVPLEIVLAPDAGELDGPALDKDGNPALGATGVSIPDPAFRKRSDRFFSAGVDQKGRFQMKGMPPDDYKLFVWDDVEPDVWFDPDFLRPDRISRRAGEDRGQGFGLGEAAYDSVGSSRQIAESASTHSDHRRRSRSFGPTPDSLRGNATGCCEKLSRSCLHYRERFQCGVRVQLSFLTLDASRILPLRRARLPIPVGFRKFHRKQISSNVGRDFIFARLDDTGRIAASVLGIRGLLR